MLFALAYQSLSAGGFLASLGFFLLAASAVARDDRGSEAYRRCASLLETRRAFPMKQVGRFLGIATGLYTAFVRAFFQRQRGMLNDTHARAGDADCHHCAAAYWRVHPCQGCWRLG